MSNLNIISVNQQKQPPEVFCKKGVLCNFANFTRIHLWWSLFLIKLQVFKPAYRNSGTRDPPHGILHLERLGGTRGTRPLRGTRNLVPPTCDPGSYMWDTCDQSKKFRFVYQRTVLYCFNVLNHLMLKLQLILSRENK